MAVFRGYRLVPGWFQVKSVASWLVSDSPWMVSGSFRSFQFVPRFSMYINVLTKKVQVSKGVPRKFGG